ncbi:MAG: cupin domain-containing protein [Candidatus Eisenbacteria bacterium]|uniref:Cupin domain-containing protein n=1 Tax=Eiseniibacteriota bacterium TaxID=2212470 RepID=A0A7Y2E6V9_UNCEI|nr:cupin domain-containing protein [Candidatus Eisenbacteria bacterium]
MLVGLGTPLIFAHEASETSADTAQKPNIAMLLSDQLERVEGTEVIVSKVQIPPNMTLPKHWHPGEEFVYVIKGSVTLWQEGKDDVVFAAGDAGKVPLKQVHTAITGDEGVELIVFRVHETGQPERVLVGDSEKD